MSYPFPSPTKKWFLASPYTDPDPEEEEKKFQWVKRLGVVLNKKGYRALFEPILVGHQKLGWMGVEEGGDPLYWASLNDPWLEACDGVLVFEVGTWKESKGVAREIQMAKEMGKEVWGVSVPMTWHGIPESSSCTAPKTPDQTHCPISGKEFKTDSHDSYYVNVFRPDPDGPLVDVQAYVEKQCWEEADWDDLRFGRI